MPAACRCNGRSSRPKRVTKNLVTALWLTLLLGIGFVLVQYIAWTELFSQGIALTGRIKDIKTTDIVYVPSGKETFEQAGDAGNVAGSFLYVITGLHIVHLLGGMIALFIVIWRANRKKYTVEKHNGVRMCALYWHFLSGLWLYLFFFYFTSAKKQLWGFPGVQRHRKLIIQRNKWPITLP